MLQVQMYHAYVLLLSSRLTCFLTCECKCFVVQVASSSGQDMTEAEQAVLVLDDICLYSSDVRRFDVRERFNDRNIDWLVAAYLKLLPSVGADVLYFSALFYPRLKSDIEKHGVVSAATLNTFTKGAHILNKRALFIPLCQADKHWLLCSVVVRNTNDGYRLKMWFSDSFYAKATAFKNDAARLIQSALQQMIVMRGTNARWQFEEVRLYPSPQQEDLKSCGCFVTLYIQRFLLNLHAFSNNKQFKMNFDQDFVSQYRKGLVDVVAKLKSGSTILDSDIRNVLLSQSFSSSSHKKLKNTPIVVG